MRKQKMSQLIWAQAKANCKARDRMRFKLERSGLPEEVAKAEAEREIINLRNQFVEWVDECRILHELYVERMGKEVTNWFFITIRPDETKCNFDEFYDIVRKYCQRKFFYEFTLSFEQKGIDDDSIGKGFHVHIVANTRHRSQSECLRDTKSTFKSIAADNCIDVKTTRNPKDIIQKYLTDYESDDNHKVATKNADMKWREKEKLDPLYTEVPPERGAPVYQVRQTGAIIVEL